MIGRKTLLSKRTTIIILIVSAIVGSFICFYATNLILSDVSNMYYMGPNQDIITSLPVFLIAVQFVAITLGVNRLYTRPQYSKKVFNRMMDTITLTSLLGCAADVVSGPLMLGSMTAPYPFRGAIVICLVYHIAMFLVSTFLSTWAQELPDDLEKKKYSAQYIVYTVFLCILVFFAYNRFGALLWAPVYVHKASLYLTWPFYLSLILPMALLMYIPITGFDLDRKNRWFTVYYIAAILVLNIVLAALVFTTGMKNPLFISAVSPALAIERLLTKPIDVIVQFVLLLALGLYALRYSIWRAKGKQKKKSI